ncbi:hypothetical protein [uncultured Tenacibaculum sp.]|uniref:hypothetical protein n=1 Tax=uncultured Tenacibaculum sp. TaxID=174713 RepID=UPI00262F4FDC|nr:hypothetical protein [uncultured Tenacibaculum sp.]
MGKIILDTFIKRGLSDRKKRILRFKKKGIEFDSSTFFEDKIEFIKYKDIKAYRFGLEWITGLYFTFGREYKIEIKTHDNQIIKLNSSSYYGLNKVQLANKQNKILDALWQTFIEKLCLKNIEKYNSGIDFKILKTLISRKGVTIKKHLVLWNKVEMKEYFDYFVIYSIDDPTNLNQAYYYKLDWNSGILLSTIKTIKTSN